MVMKIFIVIAFFSVTAAAAEWQWQHPTPQGNTLRRVQFADGMNGFAVGDFGTILATGDGGASWEVQYEGITDNILDLAMAGPSTVWIVGDNGTIVKTTNGGAVWTAQASGTANGLNGVYFFDGSSGWACGDAKTILRTTNGGTTWSACAVAGSGQVSFNSIYFISAMEGFAVGSGGSTGNPSGVIYRSTDGGATWTLLHSQPGTYWARVRGFRGTPSVLLVAGGGGKILRSSNGGAAWSAVASPIASGLNDIHFSDANTVSIAADDSTVLGSADGGLQWTAQRLTQTYAALNGVAVSSKGLIAVGEFGFMGIRNAAGSWSYFADGDNPAINCFGFAGSLNGFAAGQYGTVKRTTDGGKSWDEQTGRVPGNSYFGCESPAPGVAYLVGELGIVMHTSDGGQTWKQQPTIYPETNAFFGVSFADRNTGWVCGEKGVIIATANGGTLWSRQQSGTSGTLYDIKFIDAKNGWACGEGGVLLRTADGGASWQAQASGTASTLWSVEFVSAQTGYCSGTNGTIIRTVDGGKSWTTAATNVAVNLASVSGADESSVWSGGDGGTIIRSADKGATWSQVYGNHGFNIYGVKTIGGGVWIGGENGTISYGTFPLANAVDRTVAPAASPSLLANYPNPFNPSTTIRYTVGAGARMRISIFSSSGQLIDRLADSYHAPGDYSVQWHSVGASGMYFCRMEQLTAQGMTTIAVRKLIVIH